MPPETARIARLIAIETARERIFSVARALDRLDPALLQAQFWPDAEVDYGAFYRGPVAAFVDVAMQFQGAMRDTQHLVGNVLVRVNGDVASAESYVHAHHVIAEGEQLTRLVVGARYLSRFARRHDEWRIAFQTEVLDWGQRLPIDEFWFEQNADMPKGRRGADDSSYRFV